MSAKRSQFLTADEATRLRPHLQALYEQGLAAWTPERAEQVADVIAAQAPEIELMEGWLDDWGVPSMGGAMGDGHGGHGDGGPGGMMSDDDLDAIAEAQGDEAELLYLEGMIEHHEGAIDMAQDVLDDGESTEVAELAETIITTQQDEIDLMRDLGYPIDHFDQRAADISVEHPDVVQNYRAGRSIALANDEGRASIEDLQRAMIHYKALVDELLAPFRKQVEESGITDDELDELGEELRREARQERHARKITTA